MEQTLPQEDQPSGGRMKPFLTTNPSDRDKLPRSEDFATALYTFDVGQNDLSVGFRNMSFDQLRVEMPDIINQLAAAVQVAVYLLQLPMIKGMLGTLEGKERRGYEGKRKKRENGGV